MNIKFDLSFEEAIKACLNNEGFLRGENFKKGVFIANEDGVLVVKERANFGYTTLNNFMITKGSLEQNYRLLIAATDKALNDEM